MNKELDRADLELQLISWSKKRTAKYEELTNESYGQNPIRDLKLQNEIEEIVSEIVDIEDALKEKEITAPEKIRRIGRTYVLECK